MSYPGEFAALYRPEEEVENIWPPVLLVFEHVDQTCQDLHEGNYKNVVSFY